MNVVPTALPGVVIIEPRAFRDDRGHFFESFSAAKYREAGLPDRFAQDNISFSKAGVLRGLHYQLPNAQGKLVSALRGSVFDVAVDIRRGSPTFGRWVGMVLSDENLRQMYIPEGFAHGFAVLSECAVFHYKCTASYDPQSEGSILWDDPDLGIDWPIRDALLSPKDAAAPRLAHIAPDRLFRYEAAR
ncbi:MAG: dTDP-4-dehydrorhamnose 3,5-epimerase [Isosphaeraceae bacterium]